MTQITSSAFSATTPLCFARGRNGDVYAVNGLERGLRWDTVTANVEQLGIKAPAAAPTVSSNAASAKYYLAGIDVVNGGFGYEETPAVTVSGGVPVTLSASAATDTFTLAAHGLTNGREVRLSTAMASAIGLSSTTTYYVIAAATNTFQLAATPGGTAVNVTSDLASGAATADVSAQAVAKATVKNGAVKSVKLLRYGIGYSEAPTVECAAPIQDSNKGSGATLSLTVSGRVVGVNVDDQGGDYTSPPTASPDSGDCELAPIRNYIGNVNAIPVLNQGDGYTEPPTITTSGGGGTGLSLSPRMRYRVTGVSVTNGGSGYTGNPRVVFNGNGGGAVGEVVVSKTGSIQSVRLIHGGAYSSPPTATIVADGEQDPKRAVLKPVLSPGIIGKYWCAIRYIDDTVEAKSGPIPSSISEFAEIEVTNNSESLSWSWSNSGMDARVHKIELWRTSADQALVLYKVAEVANNVTSYTDSLQDAQLVDPSRDGFGALPITLPNGQVNARRFTPPPQNKAVISMFQDRAWYGVDVAGRKFDGTTDSSAAEPNVLYFSELDEPESVPDVNQLIIQENVKGQDRITALMPFGGGMVVFQERHAYRLSYVSQPILDANISLICQRGCLNQRCWDQYDGVAYVVDAAGMYMLDGTSAVPLSDAIDTFWTDDIIHFASSAHFFVRVDPQTRIVRFFYTESAGLPDKALCFHPITKAWWVESYSQDFAAAECLKTSGRQRVIAGGQTGSMYLFDSGAQDVDSAGAAAGIACTLRTSNFSFDPKESSRGIRFLYKPTTADCTLTLGLHYNNSTTPRTAAVMTDRGTGFVTEGGSNATLNLKKTRSALGDATGYAICSYSGRMDERSSGGDRHLAVAISTTRPSGEPAILYGVAVEGVAQ